MDPREALECAEEQEEAWSRKSSTIVQCKEIFKEMQEEVECFIPTPENTNTFNQTVRVEKPKSLKVAKRKVSELFRKKAQSTANKLVFQGQMLSSMEQEEEDIAWKACIFWVPREVMTWAVRACTNTLATHDNLARW